MSSSTQSSKMAASQASCHDPLDSLIDFTEYDKLSYQSPSLSPSTMKSEFTGGRAVPNAMPASQPDLSGPSHNYGMYRQQTGIPQGAVASTLAVNQGVSQYGFGSGYMSGLDSVDEFVDFGTAPRNGSFNASDIDMEFDSPNPEPTFFYPESASSEFINPSTMSTTLSIPAVPSTQTSNVGRLWPGMHQQQAALAKAHAQQKQQQQIIQQQRQQSVTAQKPQRAKGSHPPTDPLVEEKISQLLNSMRQNSVGSEDMDHLSNSSLAHANRMRKDEEEMDEDERLLASEEGKKLSSKERRQLRNKVSARAFRSRRKEYISQLEGEIAQKVNENQDLRSANRALLEENTRLSDLTRMLLSSPSFSGFLDTLAANPVAAPQPTRQQTEQPQQQIRKDVNPYAAQQQMQAQQHVGMTMIPEHHMDFSMLDLGNDGSYAYQPQVFSVLSLPETTIDAEVLSGKTSESYSPMASEDKKIELPKVERAPLAEAEVIEPVIEAEEIDDSDPLFALYKSSPSVSTTTEEKEYDFDINILANITIKPSAYELVVKTDDSVSDAAMRKVNRLCAQMDSVVERLAGMTFHL